MRCNDRFRKNYRLLIATLALLEARALLLCRSEISHSERETRINEAEKEMQALNPAATLGIGSHSVPSPLAAQPQPALLTALRD